MLTKQPSANLAYNSSFRLHNPGTALCLLGCFFLFFLAISSVLLPFIPRLISRPEAATKISVVIQDLLIFIVPAVGTAMIATRLPARLLCVDKWPRPSILILAIIVFLCSIPAMNAIIEWNKSWHLPESMTTLESYFRQLEENAEITSRALMKGATIPSLIVSVLIVGVLAGFSEELFFRGAFQRIFEQTRVNRHLVVWLVACIFSIFHFQLFGLIPRILLGAFFGYLLWWSKSLWLPIILHVLNNSIVVFAEYFSSNATGEQSANSIKIDNIGADLSSPLNLFLVITSVVLTTIGIYLIYRQSKLNKR